MVDTSQRGFVTDEGVVLDFAVAHVGSRAFARLVDWSIQVAILVGVIIGVRFTTDTEAPVVVATVVASFLVIFVFPALSETLWSGRTPGKAALGLRVRTLAGGPIGFRHAAVRSLLGLVDFFVPPGGATAVVSVLVSGRRQRLGDLTAGTVVMRERFPGVGPASPETFVVPHGWEAWTAELDVSALTPAQYVMVRNLLLRRDTVEWGAWVQLVDQVAERVASALRIPLGTTSRELFLTAVAAAYQQKQVGP